MLNMPTAKQISSPTPSASRVDFCGICYEGADELYQLSFLLTGAHEKAEQCFVSGLENSVKGNRVFKEWARSWARRAIIQCAVRVINPRPVEEAPPSSWNLGGKALAVEGGGTSTIPDLRPFHRCFFLILAS